MNTTYYGPTGKIPNLKNTGYKQIVGETLTPEQYNLFNQLFSQVSPQSFTSRLAGGDPSQFESMEAPAWRDFNSALGNISSRFSGMGSTGARKSSGFQNATTSAASNFAQDLQSNRLALQRQAMQELMNMSNFLLQQRPYETYFIPKQQKSSFLDQLMGGLGQGIGMLPSLLF